MTKGRRWMSSKNVVEGAVQRARIAGRLLAAGCSKVYRGRRYFHRIVRDVQHWSVFIAVLGVWIALASLVVELDDRQAERTFRAWQTVVAVQSAGSSQREAVEYLNRKFDGLFCGPLVQSISEVLTGNTRRRCIVPKKARESLENIAAAGAYLRGADLRYARLAGADLSDANLSDADLTCADLRSANLARASLVGAKLTGATLRGDAEEPIGGAEQDMNGFVPSRVEPASPPCSVLGAFIHDWGRPESTGWKSANLKDADLSKAELQNARVTQTQLDAACAMDNRHGAPLNIPDSLTWTPRACPYHTRYELPFRLFPESP